MKIGFNQPLRTPVSFKAITVFNAKYDEYLDPLYVELLPMSRTIF